MIPEPISLVQCWCVEAVTKFGDDWPMIHEHVRRKLSALADEDRIRVLQALSFVLKRGAEDQAPYQ